MSENRANCLSSKGTTADPDRVWETASSVSGGWPESTGNRDRCEWLPGRLAAWLLGAMCAFSLGAAVMTTRHSPDFFAAERNSGSISLVEQSR